LKLQRALIEYMSHQLAKGLVREKAVEATDLAALAEAVASAFQEDLMVEDRLNDEVREIMKTYSDEMTRQGVQYHDMFKMIKQQLVRKRNLIL